jgi:hypothetical protein
MTSKRGASFATPRSPPGSARGVDIEEVVGMDRIQCFAAAAAAGLALVACGDEGDGGDIELQRC